VSLNSSALSDEPQGWQARLELGFRHTPLRTLLHRRRRLGPLSVQRAFYPEGDVCHVYLLHPPGGVVGGDRLDIDLHLEDDTHVFVTTPGATKFYRSAGQTAEQQQVFHVGDNAVLEWLPQENIFFPGAQVKNNLLLHLHGNAKAALWEIQCFGRPVNNEVFDSGSLDSHWQIFRDGKPLLLERLRVDKDRLKFSSQMNRHAVTGTFIVSGVAQSLLDSLRQMTFSSQAEALALTLIDDLLVVRYLGDSTENARRGFSAIWNRLREPVLGRQALVPRIWNT
jgi:urease accessory protein